MESIRQGDVLLIKAGGPVPKGSTVAPYDGKRIVLAHGEVTGHAHAIHLRPEQIVKDAIAKAQAYARLWTAPGGDRYLEVVGESVALTHEEHTPHTIPPGIYRLPTQVEYTPSALRRVED